MEAPLLRRAELLRRLRWGPSSASQKLSPEKHLFNTRIRCHTCFVRTTIDKLLMLFKVRQIHEQMANSSAS